MPRGWNPTPRQSWLTQAGPNAGAGRGGRLMHRRAVVFATSSLAVVTWFQPSRIVRGRLLCGCMVLRLGWRRTPWPGLGGAVFARWWLTVTRPGSRWRVADVLRLLAEIWGDSLLLVPPRDASHPGLLAEIFRGCFLTPRQLSCWWRSHRPCRNGLWRASPPELATSLRAAKPRNLTDFIFRE